MSLKSSIKTVVTLGKGVLQGLPEAAEDRDPIELFSDWFHVAQESLSISHDVPLQAWFYQKIKSRGCPAIFPNSLRRGFIYGFSSQAHFGYR